MTSFQAAARSNSSSNNNNNNNSQQQQQSRMALVGRKRTRTRLGLATTLASAALAVSAAVSSVGAFQTTPPATTSSSMTPPLSWKRHAPTTQLNVLADPEVFTTLELEDLVQHPLRRGVEKDQRGQRKVPPRVSVVQSSVKKKKAASSSTSTSRVNNGHVAAASLAAPRAAVTKDNNERSMKATLKPVANSDDTAPAAITTQSSTTTTENKLPPRRKTLTKSSSRRITTMPGFQAGSTHTGRQKAFRDGVRLAESRTGKKLAQYVDTPVERKKRRQRNGEAMYKTSASVPDSLVQFAGEIHSINRITPKEEIELGTLCQEAIRLQTLWDDLTQQLDRPPTDDEWCAAAGKINLEAVRQAIEDGLEAKNKLVTSNLRMVQGVVNLYIRNGLGGQYNAGDLMQEGIMALIRAAEKFDPSRGFRFSTYAMYWIRSAVKRSQIVQSRVITVPQRLYENHKRILRTEREMREVLGRRPSRKELGDAVGMSEVQVERCVTAMNQRCFSLDQGISNTLKPMNADRSSDTLIEIVKSKSDDGEHMKQQQIFLREDLIETLKRHLSPEEVELLLLRYGLRDDLPPQYGMGPLTIAAVSQIVGLKPDKVRRMINKSLKHLQLIIGDEWANYELDFQ